MIEATKAFKTSDGQTFPTLDEAQRHELVKIVDEAGVSGSVEAVAAAILKLKPRKSKAAKTAKAVVKKSKDKTAVKSLMPPTSDLTKT